jgi:hypothetical protein
MMSRFIFPFLQAARTRERVGGGQRPFTFGKVAKQVQYMFAVLAGDDYVPRAVFRLNGHGETTFYGRNWRGWKTELPAQFSTSSTNVQLPQLG